MWTIPIMHIHLCAEHGALYQLLSHMPFTQNPQTLATPAFAGFLCSRNPLRQPVSGSEFAGLQIRVFQEAPCSASVVSSNERIAFADATLEL